MERYKKLLLIAILGGVGRGVQSPPPCEGAKLSNGLGQAGDGYGFSAAIFADTAVIGAPWESAPYELSGAVLIYNRVAGGWSPFGTFALPEGNGAGAGRALSIAGATIAFGTTWYVGVLESMSGAWELVAQLAPDDFSFSQQFGTAISITADTIVVGARNDDIRGFRSGAAYVFERDANGAWRQMAKLFADDGGQQQHFGWALAIDGDTVVIGAPDDDDLGNYSGSAYVFERDSEGWVQQDKLLPHDGLGFWRFGRAVTVNGNRALVSAIGAAVGAPNSGAVYVFERLPQGGWVETAQLVPDDIENSDFFGIAVDLEGDVALIGSENAAVAADESGAAYIFHRQPDGSWEQVAKIGAADGAFDDRFGSSLALSGTTALIGAYQDDDHGEDSGSAYFFSVSPDADGDGVMDACEPLRPTDATAGAPRPAGAAADKPPAPRDP